MNKLTAVVRLLDPHVQAIGRSLDHLRSVLLAGTRLWVSSPFLWAGWLKLTNWDSTLELFRYEYQTPLLSAEMAAIAGTVGEMVFPLLLIFGVFTRIGALGLFAVNLMAVISYWHVLGGEGFQAALAQHVFWGYMLTVVAVYGGGGISIDAWREKRSAGRQANMIAAQSRQPVPSS